MENTWQLIDDVIGHTLVGIDIEVHEFQGEYNIDNCPLQLTFENHCVIFLDGGENDSLRISNNPWVDPLIADPENTNFIQSYGKWSLLNVSNTEHFNEILQKKVKMVSPIYNAFENLCGVQFQIGDKFLNFVNVADSCRILWGENHPEINDWGYKVKKYNS